MNHANLIIPITVLFVAGLVGYSRLQLPEEAPPQTQPAVMEIPDFASYKDVNAKKQDFFDFILPMIREANQQVLRERASIVAIATKLDTGKSLATAERQTLSEALKRYRVTDGVIASHHIDELLRRMDVVPASLILAQAANESAWGTSRFARDAYNFFGIWCFEPGCGIAPAARDAGKVHEVKRFDRVDDGVAYYLHTINTHPAYATLRQIRADLRAENERLSGIALAGGLERYSERGQEYIREIRSMISYNELSRYNIDYRDRLPRRG